MTATEKYRLFTRVFLTLGFGVLGLAYAVICFRTGSLWPWSHVVHEDGIRTLLGTVFYFEHGARELLLDIVLGVTVGGCLLFACPPLERKGGGATRRADGIVSIAVASGLAVAIILAGAAIDVGLAGLRDNLLQYHTRPLAPLEWGSHWRYHLLSRLALILSALGIAGFLRLFIGGEVNRLARHGMRIFGAALVAFALFTFVFSNRLAAFLMPLFDPVYLGHQAREVFTHVLATLPIAWGICMAVVRPGLAWSADRHATVFAWPVTTAAGVLGAVLGLYVCVRALLSDSASHGQTDDLAMLLFPHFFEHVQTYVVVTAFALLVYQATLKTSRRM
ncbi:MAG: hypothetical protein OER43_01975 [Gammaproteobacteria bacterium]|nr:hypothetical protein [Gammaproteobacteria bacterium]